MKAFIKIIYNKNNNESFYKENIIKNNNESFYKENYNKNNNESFYKDNLNKNNNGSFYRENLNQNNNRSFYKEKVSENILDENILLGNKDKSDFLTINSNLTKVNLISNKVEKDEFETRENRSYSENDKKRIKMRSDLESAFDDENLIVNEVFKKIYEPKSKISKIEEQNYNENLKDEINKEDLSLIKKREKIKEEIMNAEKNRKIIEEFSNNKEKIHYLKNKFFLNKDIKVEKSTVIKNEKSILSDSMRFSNNNISYSEKSFKQEKNVNNNDRKKTRFRKIFEDHENSISLVNTSILDNTFLNDNLSILDKNLEISEEKHKDFNKLPSIDFFKNKSFSTNVEFSKIKKNYQDKENIENFSEIVKRNYKKKNFCNKIGFFEGGEEENLSKIKNKIFTKTFDKADLNNLIKNSYKSENLFSSKYEKKVIDNKDYCSSSTKPFFKNEFTSRLHQVKVVETSRIFDKKDEDFQNMLKECERLLENTKPIY